jgi:uncharacterized membrane protein YfcA
MAFNRPIPNAKPRSKAASGVSALVEAEKMMQIALLLPSAAFIGWLLGAWAGNHLHQPWMALAGIVFGGISGLVYVVRLAISASATSARTDRRNESGKGSPDDPS